MYQVSEEQRRDVCLMMTIDDGDDRRMRGGGGSGPKVTTTISASHHSSISPLYPPAIPSPRWLLPGARAESVWLCCLITHTPAHTSDSVVSPMRSRLRSGPNFGWRCRSIDPEVWSSSRFWSFLLLVFESNISQLDSLLLLRRSVQDVVLNYKASMAK